MEKRSQEVKEGDNVVVGLDIGTTKVCAIVGEMTEEGQIKIVGMGQSPSRGLRKGVVINIDEAVLSIKRAVSQAERMSGVKIEEVYTGIAGSHIRSYNSSGIVAIKGPEVTEADVRRVIDAAKAVAIPPDREIIHIIPQEFIVDDQDGINDPKGMSGTRLEVKVHIVTAAVANVKNLVRCVEKSGLRVANIALQSLASSKAIIFPEEQDLGVGLIDIGGGTTDVAVFVANSIKHSSVMGIGGDHITNDIAIGLRTPFREAEEIKKKYGIATSMVIGEDETIEIPGIGNRKGISIQKSLLAEIIEPRTEEIFSLVKESFDKIGVLPMLASGIVLTGGSSLMEGMVELAEAVFKVPVRLGKPINVTGLRDAVDSPMYSTGVGLVVHGFEENRSRVRREPISIQEQSDSRLFSTILEKMKSWFKDMF